MHFPIARLLVIALAASAGNAMAQQQGSDAVVGEKGRPAGKAVVGEKGRQASGQPSQQARGTATIPANVSQILQQPAKTVVRFRTPALKLQQLPPEVLASQVKAQDLGTPFRIEPGTVPTEGRRWYVVNAAEFGSGQDTIGLLNDRSAPSLSGKFGLTFRVEPGYRYLVDCAVPQASEMAVSHTGLGQAANGASTPVNSGIVSVVSPTVSSAGTAWIEFKALRTQSAVWRWRGCEITPLRS
jgi:hypothetical protein